MAEQTSDETIDLAEEPETLEPERVPEADLALDDSDAVETGFTEADSVDTSDTIEIVDEERAASEPAEEVIEEPEPDIAPPPPGDFDSTPVQDGFRMPAEFEPHARCWMLWPYRTDVWRNNARPAKLAFARVAQAISKFEPVTVGALSDLVDEARQMLGPGISVVPIDYNDSWARDNGPTFITDDTGNLRAVDWQFNAWGGLYEDFRRDELTANQISRVVNAKRYRADFVLEGGAIHTDGEGTLLTTEECLLNRNRNPNLSKSEIEDRLKAYLNVEKVIWLKRGVFLDETSGHIDNLACFARPGEVLLTWTDDENDPQYAISHEAYEMLASETDARGRSFKIHKLHQPSTMYYTYQESEGIDIVDTTYERLEGQRIPASYVNFYIANGGIVMPIFQDAEYDAKAAEVIQTAFPDKKLRAVFAREILLGGGNIHCITQQQPRVEKKRRS